MGRIVNRGVVNENDILIAFTTAHVEEGRNITVLFDSGQMFETLYDSGLPCEFGQDFDILLTQYHSSKILA